MISLGCESSAHTFGIGIVDEKCRILANEKKSYIKEDSVGIHPREAADFHYENALSVLENALEKASLKINEVDLIAFSQGPGLGNCLKVGAVTARTLSLIHKKPLIGVNHCIAHIEIGRKLTKSKDPITCYASGANTQIIGLEKKRYRIFGETLDIGIGNFLDVFGREINLGFPAGPKMDEMYFTGKELIELPYTVKGMDLAFSGLLTAGKKMIGKEKQSDLVFSLMHNAFAMLTEVTERALAHTGKKEVLLTGGVASSKALREMMKAMCKQRKAKFFVPPREVCIDNGSMIGWLGLLMYKRGITTKIENSEIKPKQRTDQVKVSWE
jgi:universal protein Kae1